MFGGLGMLAFWGLLIGLVLWGVRAFAGGRGNDNGGASRPTPLEIVQARYARGEISREEYETIRRDLQSS
jgi:putative membrane protein